MSLVQRFKRYLRTPPTARSYLWAGLVILTVSLVFTGVLMWYIEQDRVSSMYVLLMGTWSGLCYGDAFRYFRKYRVARYVDRYTADLDRRAADARSNDT